MDTDRRKRRTSLRVLAILAPILLGLGVVILLGTATWTAQTSVWQPVWHIRWGDSPRTASGELTWLNEPPSSHGAQWQITGDTRLQRPDDQTTVWLHTRLPDSLPQGAIFATSVVEFIAEFYIDGKLIAKRGNLDLEDIIFQGWATMQIPLNADFAGKDLFIRARSDHNVIGLGRVSIAQAADLATETHAGDVTSIAISFLGAVWGLILLGVGLANYERREFAALGGLLLGLAVWIFSLETHAHNFIVADPLFWSKVSNVAFFANGVFIPLFVRLLLRADIFGILKTVTFVAAALLAVTLITFPTNFPSYKMIPLGQIVGLVSMLATCVLVGQRAWKGDTESRIFGVGLVVFLVLVVIRILEAQSIFPHIPGIVPLASLSLFGTLSYILMRRIYAVHQELRVTAHDLSQTVGDLLGLVGVIRGLSQTRERRHAALHAAKYLLDFPAFATSPFELFLRQNVDDSGQFLHFTLTPSTGADTTELSITENNPSPTLPHGEVTSHAPHIHNDSLLLPIAYDDNVIALFSTHVNNSTAELDARSLMLLESLAHFLAVLFKTFGYFEQLNRRLADENIILERAVTDRTRDLEASKKRLAEALAHLNDSSQRLRSVLSNINQGILLCGPDQKVMPEYSRSLEVILGNSACAGKSLVDLIFTNSDLGTDQQQRIRDILSASLGESELTFLLNQRTLPSEFNLARCDGENRIIECEWTPILSEGEVQRIMLTLRDVTEIRKLRAQAAEERKNMETLVTLVAAGLTSFDTFAGEVTAFLGHWLKPEIPHQAMAAAELKQFLQELHTLKGEARTLGITDVVSTIHNCEHLAQQSSGQDRNLIQEQLIHLRQELEHYITLRETRLQDPKDSGVNTEKILDEALLQIHSLAENLPGSQPHKKSCQAVMRQLIQLRYPTLTTCVTSCQAVAIRLAGEYGLEGITIDLHADEEWILTRPFARTLRETLLHFVRNAVVHAAEPPHPLTLTIEASKTDHEAKLLLRDSGRGLDLTALREKGIKLGIINTTASRDEIAQIVFESGLSTAARIDEVAGRGVGMGAARALLERSGGKVNLVVDSTVLPNGRSGFVLEIICPQRMIHNAESLPKAS